MSTPVVTVPPPLIVLRWLAWNALLRQAAREFARAHREAAEAWNGGDEPWK